jgi:hypothetical protein
MEHEKVQPFDTMESQMQLIRDADEALLASLGYKQGGCGVQVMSWHPSIR